ncbi:hypothetical protein [Streptomyces sp. CBMA29]|uniref:hypothetical protein n=1 Tax=Streptomyces sp. CBMA29 TaxID=1896314 RepID=UPI0016619D64|nr:hypothetical protein [Streptomyces sp. CBMA29]MBD0737772.1 hypothetical protein [Streptomyces sp. CBMA29]
MMYDAERARQPATGAEDPAFTERWAKRESRPEPLLPQKERDDSAALLQRAAGSFGESPRQALDEADQALDAASGHLAEVLAERLRVLRARWQDEDAVPDGAVGLLRDYRELTERLLRL